MINLACLAAGIDRSALPTVISLVRPLNEGRPTASRHAGGFNLTYAGFSPQAAAEAFKTAARAV